MHQALLGKSRLFDQNTVDRTSKSRPVHFGFESSRGPTLKKTSGHSIAHFEFRHCWTDSNHFPSSIRQRHPPLDRSAIVLSAEDEQIAIVERSCSDPDHHIAIARNRRRPIHQFQTFRSTVLLNLVAGHWGSCQWSVVSGKDSYRCDLDENERVGEQKLVLAH